ncbi:helix-turn-helix domain-containing protein [Paenibacillus sp. WLX1005]|uniref:helix-turn-helix domain-containing protein n=1 Tax=Paenibacillus sp. WLX1005 TaxID=3243766 RepID=UPI003983F19F
MLNSERLKNERVLQNLTQEDMANKLGITRQAYGNYEAGKRDVDSQTLVKLANILEISVDYLLDLSTSKTQLNSTNPIQQAIETWTLKELELAVIVVEGWRKINN